MALLFCHIIAYIQILSAGFNLWGVDPRILVDMPLGRNTLFVGLFLLSQLLGLVGAVLLLQHLRLGFLLSIAHHILHLPAMVITGLGLVMLMDDRINVTLLFMSKPTGADVSLFWSLGWGTVFQQVTRDVPSGATYIGINLFAFACIYVLWVGLDELDAAAAEAEYEYEMEMRRGQRPGGRAQLALPPPQAYPKQQQRQPQRPPPQQSLRQPPRTPPRGSREQRW